MKVVEAVQVLTLFGIPQQFIPEKKTHRFPVSVILDNLVLYDTQQILDLEDPHYMDLIYLRAVSSLQNRCIS